METVHFRHQKHPVGLCGVPETSGQPDTELPEEITCLRCLCRYEAVYGTDVLTAMAGASIGATLPAGVGTQAWRD